MNTNQFSTDNDVSAETNHEPVSTGQLSTDNNVSAQNTREPISPDQLSTSQRQNLDLSDATNFQRSGCPVTDEKTAKSDLHFRAEYICKKRMLGGRFAESKTDISRMPNYSEEMAKAIKEIMQLDNKKNKPKTTNFQRAKA